MIENLYLWSYVDIYIFRTEFIIFNNNQILNIFYIGFFIPLIININFTR